MIPYQLSDITNKVINRDCLSALKEFPSDCVDLVVTSPPYYNLRNYDHDNQIGMELTPKDYVTNLVNVFRECKRIIKNTGAIWLNIADSYGTISGGSEATVKGKHKQYGNISHDIDKVASQDNKKNLIQKSLIGIPERLVIAMQDELGLIRRNTIIWHKPSCMPQSAEDRFTIDFEYFYFFVKNNDTVLWKHRNTKEWTSKKPKVDFTNPVQENIHWEWYISLSGKKKKRSLWKSYDYFFETQKEPMKTESLLREGRARSPEAKYIANSNMKNFGIHYPRENINQSLIYNGKAKKDYKGNGVQDSSDTKRRVLEGIKRRHARFGGNKYNDPNNLFKANDTNYRGSEWIPNEELERIMRCVWALNTPNTTEEHFATYPEKLIETPIKACTRKGDLVLDPFLGSGTTAILSQKLQRNYIGIELNPKYVSIARRRLNYMISSYIK